MRYVTNDSRVRVSAGRIRYARYARVSGCHGSTSPALAAAAQLAGVPAWLDSQGLRGTCAGDHVDIGRATCGRRGVGGPALRRLLTSVHAGRLRVDLIVAESPDRLTSDGGALYRIADRLRRRGIRLAFVR